MLETERLIIRKMTLDDLPWLIETRSDPQMYKYLGGWEKQNPEAVTKRMSFYQQCYEKFGFGQCAMIWKETGEKIGCSGLQPLEQTGEIEVGYSVVPEYWRRGIGFEGAYAWMEYGFDKCGLERIVAVADQENTGSWRIMEKCGMKFEGIQEHYGMPRVFYAASKEDFNKITRYFMKALRIVLVLTAICFGAFSAFADQKPKDNWAKFGDVKLHYYDIGNSKAKQALVFVHCWTCNVEFWKDSYGMFPNYRVIALDLPGHGRSDKPKVEYSMDYFARAVNAVLEKAGVSKVVIVGHSMGTPVIRRFYELYPEKTLAMVVVDGALITMGPREQMEKFYEPLTKDYKAAAAGMIDGMLQPAQPDTKTFVRPAMLETPDYVGTSAAKAMLADAYAPHGKINVPLLAVMAPSPYWPKDLKEQYTAIAPAIEFHAFTGVSHFVMLDKPKEFNETLGAFITKNQLL